MSSACPCATQGLLGDVCSLPVYVKGLPLRFHSSHQMTSRPVSTRPIGRAFCAATLGFAATISAALAQPAADGTDELTALINQYRSASHSCKGQPTVAAGPLAPVAALAAVDGSSGAALQRSLTEQGYIAAQVQFIAITGPNSPREAMRFLEPRYCQALSSLDHAEIGVSRDGKRWRIALARPLLSRDLQSPQDAGRDIVRLANRARSEARRCGDEQFAAAPPLEWDAALGDIALSHSQDMAVNERFAHRGSDGTQVNDRASRAGYAWRSVGENLATGQGSSESAMAAWLASPNHCENIMNATFTKMGAAYALNRNSESVIYWTQVFARPRSGSADAQRR